MVQLKRTYARGPQLKKRPFPQREWRLKDVQLSGSQRKQENLQNLEAGHLLDVYRRREWRLKDVQLSGSQRKR